VPNGVSYHILDGVLDEVSDEVPDGGSVITYVCKGGIFPSEGTPWKKNERKREKNHKSAEILSQRCDVMFWRDMIRCAQFWVVNISAPQIDGRRSYWGFNIHT
jgi:hypothetical protein